MAAGGGGGGGGVYQRSLLLYKTAISPGFQLSDFPNNLKLEVQAGDLPYRARNGIEATTKAIE